MRYGLEFTASASRELRSLSRHIQIRVIEKVKALCDDPFPPGVKKLPGEPGHFRIRIGDNQVVYRIDGARVIVVIVRVGHRQDVYR